jgi:hypothetical protein
MDSANLVSNTLNFKIGRSDDLETHERAQFLSELINGLENADMFRGFTIICAENNTDGHFMQNYYGVQIALGILRENPKAKIVLFHYSPLSLLIKHAPAIGLVNKHENVYLIRFWEIQKWGEIFTQQKSVIETGYTTTDEVNKYLSQLFHDLGHVFDWSQNSLPKNNARFDAIMASARNYFPGLKEKSDAEIVTFLKETKVERPLVKKGEYLDGVYCDLEGTLWVNGKENEKVTKLLDQCMNDGENVTIWTDGNIEEMKAHAKLPAWIICQLKSKHDFAGAKAKVVIDDMREYEFSALTKISAETFIHVSEIAEIA